MTLFSRADDPWSHRTRIVLAEKSIHVETIDVQDGNLPEDLLDLNPYHSVPTLVDRDLVLYDSRVIIEYLDERFPHPPLMPVDPVARAQFRLALYRIERDWYSLAQQIDDRRRSQAGRRRRARSCATAFSPAPTCSRRSRISCPTSSRSSTRRSRRSSGACRLGRSICRRRRRSSASTRIWCSRGRPFATACRASSRRCAPKLQARTMADAPVRSRRPYLLRAMHEWITRQRADAAHRRRRLARRRRSAAAVRAGRQDHPERQSQRDQQAESGQRCRAFPRALRRSDARRQRADRRRARHLRARNRAGDDFLGGRRAAAAAGAAERARRRRRPTKRSAPSRR